jgi:hypothetical protein
MLTLSLESSTTKLHLFLLHRPERPQIPRRTPVTIFVIKTREFRTTYSSFCLNKVHNDTQ